MSKYTLFCALTILASASTLEIKPISQVVKDIKVDINNKVGDAVGKVGDVLTEIPLHFAQGQKGKGDWLAGIVDKVEHFTDPIKQRRKEKLEQYTNALLHRSPDATLKFAGLVGRHGYPVEEYEVRTDDGYLLTVFRIPYGVHSPVVQGVKRPVVFLMHGLVDCSDDWIILGPGKSLGYLLADAGYDVWFGNARGNTYSKKHVTRKPTDVSFWEFSWDEIGRFDLPAMIDFVLEKTDEKKLYYVGHSQGTTSFFVMASMRPEYNDKIRIMYALAPIAFMSNMVSPLIRLVSPQTKGIDWITHTLGIGEFLPNNNLLSIAGGELCKDRAITQDICYNSVFIICGFDLDQMNTTMLPVIMGHAPSGSSVRQFLHYGQGVVSKAFRRYDFGLIKNKQQYGDLVPPNYELGKIRAPVALFYSENDWLSHPKDVTELSRKLGNLAEMYPVPHPKFNHMDYMWAEDVDKIVHERILKTMKNY